MVTEVIKNKETLYRCDAPACQNLYRNRELAEKCQQWCEVHKA